MNENTIRCLRDFDQIKARFRESIRQSSRAEGCRLFEMLHKFKDASSFFGNNEDRYSVSASIIDDLSGDDEISDTVWTCAFFGLMEAMSNIVEESYSSQDEETSNGD